MSFSKDILRSTVCCVLIRHYLERNSKFIEKKDIHTVTYLFVCALTPWPVLAVAEKRPKSAQLSPFSKMYHCTIKSFRKLVTTTQGAHRFRTNANPTTTTKITTMRPCHTLEVMFDGQDGMYTPSSWTKIRMLTGWVRSAHKLSNKPVCFKTSL